MVAFRRRALEALAIRSAGRQLNADPLAGGDMEKSTFAFAILLAAVGSRSEPYPHLVPEYGPFSAASLPEYYTAVRAVLFEGVSDATPRVIVLPSFEPEWSVWVDLEPEPRSCSRAVESPLWNDLDPARPNRPSEISTPNCAPLQLNVAQTVAAGWYAMLRGTRYPTASNGVSFDGVSYHFAAFVPGLGDLEGQTHSPNSDTPTGRFVALVEALRAYSVAPSVTAQQSLCQTARSLLPFFRRLTRRCS